MGAMRGPSFKPSPRLVPAARPLSALLLGTLGLGACGEQGVREGDAPPLPLVVGDSLRASWSEGPSLPAPVANNAVASLLVEGRFRLYGFLGIDSTKRHDGITRAALEREPSGGWRLLPPIAGREGRLAATAEAVGGRLYVFGGYTVAADGNEASVPEVDVWDPAARRWEKAVPIPLPVDDAVSGVWRDSLIYLVSGWSQRDNVPDVQVYDPAADRWERATPIPGPPVFGHAGGIADDAIVYCGGARVDRLRDPRFVISGSCWRGDIDPRDPARVAWRELAPQPGVPKYRAAAGTPPGSGLVVFAGGTDNPYNFDGVGYDGVPSEPDGSAFAYDVRRDAWVIGPAMPVPTMDHRGLAWADGALWAVGGMTAGRRVTATTAGLVVGDPELPAELATGRATFHARCATCHGFRATGSGRGPPLAHPVYRPAHHADAAFRLAVANGVRAHHWSYGDMPPVAGVEPAAVERIIAYVRWLQRQAGID